jgi:hypothetical protein
MMNIEPALPKKTLGRNKWTDQEVDTLMSMAAEFADQQKRIRWREIAAATGHHESSCALKYHTIRSRAAGRLARELIDADQAAKQAVNAIKPVRPTSAGAYPVWSADEDARLLKACDGDAVQGIKAWQALAETFPGRSFYAVRQRYLSLRNQPAGIVRDRDRMSRPLRPQKRAPAGIKAHPEPLPQAEYATITAAFFRDPPPGRSALDKMRAGIAEDHPLPSRYHTRWEAAQASRPKITLATEPMR